MKVNLTKLGKIQREFRLGNIGNFTALEIKNLLNEDGNLTLSFIIETAENNKSFKAKLGENKLDKLTEDERQILKMCDEKLHIGTQYHKTSLYGGSIMFLIVKYENTIVKIFSYNNHESSEEELYEEDLDKITETIIITYTCKNGYATKIE